MVETEAGIPVTDKLTIEKCGTCHAPDAKGNLSRISWVRATPEGWAQTIKRMVELNGAPISPVEAKGIVKYLATWHGLAPEEAKPVMYMAERRILDETNIPNETVRTACASCHAFGQPMSSRRTRTEWALLQNMHVALYPQAEAQYRRRMPGAEPADGAPPPPTPGEVALDYISKAAALHTPEWAAWQPRIRDPKLAGTWIVSATVPGKGRFVGEMTIAPGSDPADFTTSTTLHSLTGGTAMTRKGSGIIYSGYSWRGRSQGALSTEKPDDLESVMRETMWFSPDQKSAEGRWYWGEYHEFGMDVKLTRVSADPVVVSVSPYAIKVGSTGVSVHIYGANLPSGLTAADLDLGAGVTVKKVASASANEVVATVDVASAALPGLRDVGIRGTVLQKALPIYKKVDYLKVTPETSLAHLGGEKYPKGYQQYDAIGFDNGLDGKPNTADDIPLGSIDVTWSVQEFSTVTYDDDKDFVGTLSPAALFVPSVEGPNPKRRFSRNNYGEVWVVATAKSEKDAFGRPLTARSYLVVTVPTYKRWDQPEVSQ
ncbi:quinohemoprotein amine dehydrogenase subunit alpha [Sphingobium sp. H33]|uniref:Quinohemoprotein amine dehydrogenase subunit alpha n=2 Tax=Sphingobium nicotianae TaxID=2782607 RepID=A0A9X1DC77_9SPHN|nr:quinohemoprotein amine dehydrogenase subunit alpha [Sphingobium nicotianae]